MGTQKVSINGNQKDVRRAFDLKLLRNLEALRLLLLQPGFGVKAPESRVFGAELETYIIDKQGLPLCINQAILGKANDPLLTLELNQYNLEYNLKPYSIKDQPFIKTEQDIAGQLNALNDIAREYDGRVIPIGILPTLKQSDFGCRSITDKTRYRILLNELIKRRGTDFLIDINGEHPLKLSMSDSTLEGANTSFQIHYRINPEEYADTFNAFQFVTPLVLALSANSPGIFGHNLWQETRIPLFKQSIDTRIKDRYSWHEPVRVCFGTGWLRDGAYELFQQSINLWPSLFVDCDAEEPLESIATGDVPGLAELRLHQSSVWLWNRPVYDPADGGHLRIELRALPAGPTPADMAANAAFYIGLAEYYKPLIRSLMPALTFHHAEYNFYRAAQFGLDADIVWPSREQCGCSQRPIVDVLEEQVDKARTGLERTGFSKHEIDTTLSNIEKRIAKRQSGASWQRDKARSYEKNHSRSESLHLMLEDYIRNAMSNTPVSEWR